MKRREFSVAALTTCTFGPSAYAQANKKPEEGIEYVSLDKRVPTEVGDGKVEVLELLLEREDKRLSEWRRAMDKIRSGVDGKS